MTLSAPLRRCFIATSLVLTGAGLAWLGLGWWAAGEIAKPGRRLLQDYHQEILAAPAAHGMRVEIFTAADGTPCLLCLPSANLGQRGERLRSQLEDRQARLMEIGQANDATLVLLHGRRGRKEDNLPIAERFCAAGFRCVLPDLPGHGEHPASGAGYGPTEAGLPLAVLREAAERFEFAARPAGLWGISMGGSVAVHAAARDPEAWQALVVVASFDALEPVIARQSEALVGRWAGPALLATVRTFFHWRSGGTLAAVRPDLRAPQVKAATLIAHGNDDPLIPLDAARRLYAAHGASEKLWVDVGSGTHGNVLVTPQPLYAEMAIWFLRHLSEAR